jgi:hypothetical protein
MRIQWEIWAICSVVIRGLFEDRTQLLWNSFVTSWSWGKRVVSSVRTVQLFELTCYLAS